MSDQINKNAAREVPELDVAEYIDARISQWNTAADHASTEYHKAIDRVQYWNEQKRLYEAGELDQ